MHGKQLPRELYFFRIKRKWGQQVKHVYDSNRGEKLLAHVSMLLLLLLLAARRPAKLSNKQDELSA